MGPGENGVWKSSDVSRSQGRHIGGHPQLGTAENGKGKEETSRKKKRKPLRLKRKRKKVGLQLF